MRRTVLILAAALLSACSGGDGVTSSPFGVTGKVLGSDRLPVAGARVATRTGGGWRSTTTDLEGTFSLLVDGAPYDLAVIKGEQVELYVGVTRASPEVRLGVPGGTTPLGAGFTTTITGDCGGAGCPPAGHEGSGQLTFSAGTVGWVGVARSPGTLGTYSATLGGTDVATGTLAALYWACPGMCTSSAPDAFWLARQDSVTLRIGASTDVSALALAPLPTAPLAVNVTAPDGVSPQAMMGFALGTPAIYWLHAAGSAAPGASTFLMPTAPDLRTMLYVIASPAGGGTTTASWSGGTSPASPVELALHPLPVLLEPAEGATLGVGTRFAWSSEPGVHVLALVSSTPGAADVRVTTAEQSFTVPDLAALGLYVPAGAAYVWSVRAQPSTVDARLAPASTTPPPIPPTTTISSWSTLSATRAATAL
ncbi:hypothetical protein [Anaeromyxobacter sp. SG26]|uniref:hypothetical protein n=1 Tax=Anaeromyxobacter sp. SG26 TaxID=2925407 RepID=UPI001F5AB20C|nr:hypothetical protein [Anaeromyxobacter sp. SG26]